LSDISNQTLIATSHLSSYLSRLRDLKLVDRRLPATVPPAKRRRSRQGRYHLQDPFFRFYFRFIAPFHDYLPFDTDTVLDKVKKELRAFVGQTTFEELARQWVIQQGKAGNLPFVPDIVGSHWSRHVQVDVAAVNWQSRQILLGECKWGQRPVNRQVVRELIERKTPRLKRDLTDTGEGWGIFYVMFSRAGFTESANVELQEHDGLAIALATLDDDLK
jgi:AAA+ ATPase superfamily predicted ATPase